MDFIQRAIDKARDQRKPDIAPAPSPAAAPGLNRLADTAITYTQTRSVRPKPDHLLRERIVAAFDSDKRAEPYRQLRTQVLRRMREKQWRTLAVTSPNSHAGKTLTALNLAISISREVNQTVLLVDLDLRNPTVMQKLGIQAEFGLMDCLEKRCELKDVLVNPGFERLVVLPSLPGTSHRSEILSSPTMTTLLQEIVNRYDSRIVVFDLPALLDDDDALAFTPFVDALMLVVEDGSSSRGDIERALLLMQGTPLLGTVLNKVR
ncbi:MAG: CpsD/CapB family tyrosine-protein kinase [Spongiibacteraceae bacterium]|nr:CpsD/CapB family tyrosine-protein kinase [Spongiibacteraceae bacterium]